MNLTEEFKRLSFGGGGAADDIFDIVDLDEAKLNNYIQANRLLFTADLISNTYIWVVFSLGVPGNILAIITILTLQVIDPTTFFIAVLAFLDALCLFGKLIGHQLVRNRVYIGNVGCKFQFLIICAGTLANWILVVLCAERFFSLCHPKKKKLIFTNRNCYFVVTVLAVTFLAFFAGISGAMRSADTSGLRCGTYTEYLWFWVNVWFWINSALYLFLPFLCVFPLIMMMVRKLHIHNWKTIHMRTREIRKRHKARSEKMQNGRQTTGTDIRKEHESHDSEIQSGYETSDKEMGKDHEEMISEQPHKTEHDIESNEGGFTLMVIVASLLFFILSLPGCVYYLTYRRSNDVLEEAKWALFEQIQFVLIDSRHAINCFLYFLASGRFRAHLVNLFLCRPCRDAKFSRGQEDAQFSISI